MMERSDRETERNADDLAAGTEPTGAVRLQPGPVGAARRPGCGNRLRRAHEHDRTGGGEEQRGEPEDLPTGGGT